MILTGDYHYADVKALQPGEDTYYAEWYASEDFQYPIYQASPPSQAHMPAAVLGKWKGGVHKYFGRRTLSSTTESVVRGP